MPKSEDSAGPVTTEEKYTLPRVLEIVRGHAEALEEASTALYFNDCKEPKLLRTLGILAYDAAEELWEIDGRAPPGHDADLFAAWHTFGRMRCTVDLLSRPMFTLPALVLAVEAATKDPHGQLPAGKRWDYCRYQADDVAEDLMAWVKAHEKDAGKPKENGGSAQPISPAEEPKATEEDPDPERSFTLAWVITMMKTYADAFGSAATALDAVQGEDTGVLSLLSERARAAAGVLWNIEGGEGSLHRTPELEEAWEAHEPAKLMQRILWQLPLLELGAEAAGAGGGVGAWLLIMAPDLG